MIFVGGDTTFNESFATAVEREGVRRWLAANGDEASRQAYAEFAQRRHEFLNLLLQYRGLLFANYQGRAADDIKRARKQQIFAELKDDYARLRASWGGFAGYDRFFAQDLTNAHLAVDRRLQRSGAGVRRAAAAKSDGDFPRFYEEVKRLAAMPGSAATTRCAACWRSVRRAIAWPMRWRQSGRHGYDADTNR